MSPNQKKALALAFAGLLSIIVGLVAAITLDTMEKSASGWACVGVGSAAWAALFFGSVGVIGLFEFTDTRPVAAPPQGQAQAQAQAQPPPPGAPVV
ncbi:hypothetical protein JTP77_005270 [Streptomyces sp. S9]|nr:hypothetical protein [Streptomyces sp. S9]